MNVVTFTVGKPKRIRSIFVALIALLGVHFFCYLPLVLGLIGLGNVNLVSHLVFFRPVLLSVSIIAMIFANLFTFVRNRNQVHIIIILIMDFAFIGLLFYHNVYSSFLHHH